MRRRILIIDDDPIVRSALARLLRFHYEIDVAADAESALSLVTDAYDVVLCDLAMPGTSGVDLFHRIRELHPNVAKRVIFMTGGAHADVVAEVTAELNRPLLLKPFAVNALDAAVARVLDEAKPTQGG